MDVEEEKRSYNKSGNTPQHSVVPMDECSQSNIF
jgi:hypothetical protein